MAKNDQDERKGTYESDRLMACLTVGKLLTSTFNLRDILELIMHKLNHLIEAENWSLFLKDQKTGELTFEIVVGIDEEEIRGVRIAPGQGIVGYVAETGVSVYQSDVENDPRFNKTVDLQTGFKTRSVVSIPITIHGKILGVIEIINVKDMEEFKEKDLPVLTILADYAAIAIENSRNFEKIQRMSITDEYTGCYNVRYMHQVLDELIERADKRKSGLAIVFGDIDAFKSVVDEYGHLLGSQVLKEIAQTISECLTEKDILVKYGGDEYVIILPDRTKQEAVDLTNTILQRLRESSYLQSQAKPVNITASFGVAMYPDDANSKKDLLRLADNSMYRIKKSRKNAVGAA